MLEVLDPVNSMEKELDEVLKQRWATMMFTIFMDHFKAASPNGWEHRFHPFTMKAYF
jgi:hypothetical protein